MNLQFHTLTQTDLPYILRLQPDGWPDIRTAFENYLERDFCFPVKVISNSTLLGLGAWVNFGKTGWLAHVIVDKAFRNKGIGYRIVEFLLEEMQNASIETFLLIATDLGEPVYKKAGFKMASDYIKFERTVSSPRWTTSEKIIPYRENYYADLIKLDERITGETRESLIREYVSDSVILIDNGSLKGFYLPGCGDGPVIAENKSAGIELMKYKYSGTNIAVIPSENKGGIDFLEQSGFAKTDTTLRRMILGKNISWKPENIFSRIGGNYG